MSNKEEKFAAEVESNDPEAAQQYVFDDESELVAELNTFCRIVAMNGKRFFVMPDYDGVPEILDKQAAEIELAQFKLEKTKKRGITYVPGFKVWLESPDRALKYERVVFNPNKAAVKEWELNLFCGFAVKPSQKSEPEKWKRFRDHLLNNVCQKNKDHYNYLFALFAQMFQDPEHKPGICIVLRGEPGTGKTKVGQVIRRIVGPRHSLVVDKAEQWTGRFTSQLEICLFLMGEEAMFAGSPKEKASAKHLITTDTMSYEKKNRPIHDGPNFTRILITSNEDWVVPADPGDRRFFVLDVANTNKEDHPYFIAIDDEMASGGAAALLHDLLAFDYRAILSQPAPVTAGLQEQMRMGLKPEAKWWSSVLSEGRFPFGDDSGRSNIDLGPDIARIAKNDVYSSFVEYVSGYRAKPTREALSLFLKKVAPDVKLDVRAAGDRYYEFPSLADMRKEFLKQNPKYPAFTDETQTIVRTATGEELRVFKGKERAS